MKLGSFTQHPLARESYTIHYADDLSAGDNLQEAQAGITPPGLRQEGLFVFDNHVRIWLAGGVQAQQYTIMLTVKTEDGRILIDHFTVKVKE